MKVFDFTDGKKGAVLGNIPLMDSNRGWLVVKNGSVYKVTVADAPTGWEWTNGATYLRREEGDNTTDVEISPEDFGVEAICFCWGQTRHDKIWNWLVMGTTEWNRNACKRGILKSTFSHTIAL